MYIWGHIRVGFSTSASVVGLLAYESCDLSQAETKIIVVTSWANLLFHSKWSGLKKSSFWLKIFFVNLFSFEQQPTTDTDVDHLGLQESEKKDGISNGDCKEDIHIDPRIKDLFELQITVLIIRHKFPLLRKPLNIRYICQNIWSRQAFTLCQFLMVRLCK